MSNVDVGASSLNLYVVMPSRFQHTVDGSADLIAAPCYIDMAEAVDNAKTKARQTRREYCVYKLESVYTATQDKIY